MPAQVLTVAELTVQIKLAVQGNSAFQNVFVRGEISNFSRPASGHLYFTLKDDKARLRVVMFAGKARFLRFQLKDGLRIVVNGSLDVFEKSGDYQLYADSIQPDGIGALYLAYEQLKAKLAAEGLFDTERKRPLPVFPKRIALVTSATGAAVRDMITTLARRYPLGKILVVPVAVQGDEAAAQIADGIILVNRFDLADVLIVGRGGGSFEELFAFNTEVVARAIAASKIPVISAVGHETDVSIADFVADVRAATPTAAAELVAPNQHELNIHLRHLVTRMNRMLVSVLQIRKERMRRLLESRVFKDPLQKINMALEQVDMLEGHLKTRLLQHIERHLRMLNQLELRLAHIPIDKQIALETAKVASYERQLQQSVAKTFQQHAQQLEHLLDKLELLSPLAVMRRGYAVVFQSDHSGVITNIDQVQPGDAVRIDLHGGWLDCQVWGVHEHQERK